MTKQNAPAELAAEASNEDTLSFIRRVKRTTRRKYTPEAKVRIVLESFRGEIGVSALCRREGIHLTVYYAWLKDFMGLGRLVLRLIQPAAPPEQRWTPSSEGTSG
jgi:transposase